MALRVLVHDAHPEPLVAILEARHPDVEIVACSDYESLPEALAGAQPEVMYGVRFAGTPGYPRAAILATTSLRWVAIGGSGTDHLAPWDATRLTVTNAAGVAAEAMAEYAMAAILGFAMNFPAFASHRQARRWVAGRVEPIAGKTLLILGLGHTGRTLARRAEGAGLRVLGVRARPAPTPHVAEVHSPEALPGLWPRADFVAVCLPLTPATRGLIGAAAFAAMRPGAVLIDVSRGGIVVEAALIAALRGGRLKGAALDVFEHEPLPAENPLWGFENVIVTPHCSSVYEGWERRSMAMFCDNLARWRRGEALRNVVDPARGY